MKSFRVIGNWEEFSLSLLVLDLGRCEVVGELFVVYDIGILRVLSEM